jgi:hypothetical protein
MCVGLRRSLEKEQRLRFLELNTYLERLSVATRWITGLIVQCVAHNLLQALLAVIVLA